MKQKTQWFLSVLLLSASLLPGCEKKDDENLTNLALLGALSGGGDCSVAFPGKSAVSIDRTKVTRNAGPTLVTWGRIPFVNHPIAIVEILDAGIGQTVTFNGVDVVENPQASGEATVYQATDCPLAESTIINGFDAFSSSTFGDTSPGPYVWTNTVAGSYYFLLYIVGTTEVATTVTYDN